MTSIPYTQAMYCPDCDLLYLNAIRECPRCCNKNGVSMNCIRNNMIKLLDSLTERRKKIRPHNNNQLSLF